MIVKTEYEIDMTKIPYTCFPINMDTSGFINISIIGDSWGVYFDPTKNIIHDCKHYFEEMNRLS